MFETKTRIGQQPGVQGHYRQGRLVLEVDPEVATFKGYRWRDLGGFGKRKFENALFIENVKDNPVFIYV